MKELLHIWRIPTVRRALPALTLAVFGESAAFVALTLRVHATGAGPYAVTALLLCFALPVILTMGVAGDWADRLDHRMLIPLATGLQAAAALALAALQSLTATYVLVLLLQLGYALASPCWTTVLTRAVGEDTVGTLVSAQHSLSAAAAPAGAAAGGVLVEWRGDPLVFAGVAVGYVLLGLTALTIARPTTLPGHTSDVGRGGLSALFPRDGWHVLRRNPLVWTLTRALLAFIVALESMNAVEVFLIRDVLGGSDADFGGWQAMVGAGALAGALVSGLVTTDCQRLQLVRVCLTLGAAVMVGIGVAPSLAVAFGLGAVQGGANALVNAAFFAIVIRATDEGHRGRLLALLNGLARSTSVAALGLGGLAGATLGPRLSFVLAGAVGLVIAGWVWASTRCSGGHDSTEPV